MRQEEVTIIILKHENTKEGLQRTQKLFSTLNRRAKPTSTAVNIAIDEDDGIAICTRRLVKENQTLKLLVLSKLGSKQITPSKSNDPYITTLQAFYETNEILLSAYNDGLEIDRNFKQFRPPNEKLDEYYDFLEDLWMCMIEKCPGFDEILSGRKKPGEIRKRKSSDGSIAVDEAGKPIAGGSVFARPMGQYIVAEVLKTVGIQGKSIKDAVEAIMTHISMDIDEFPWVRAVWNPSTRRIMGGKAERTLIASMISHALGLKIKYKVRELKQKYRDTIEDQKAPLLSPIDWSGRTDNTSSEDDLRDELDESSTEREN